MQKVKNALKIINVELPETSSGQAVNSVLASTN